MVSNQKKLFNTLNRSLRFASVPRYRVLLVLAGNANLHLDLVLDAALDTFNKRATTVTPVTIVHVPDRHSNSDVSDQINALLGSENQCLIFDGNAHFDERLFAASASTVVAGGLLILQVPSLEQWPQLSLDICFEKNHLDETNSDSAFIKRFVNKLIAHQSQSWPEENSVASDSAVFIGALDAMDVSDSANSPEQFNESTTWKIEQRRLIDQLHTHLLNSASGVAVVQGDRGRGKSALIGLALNALKDSPTSTTTSITMTANRFSSCKVLLKHVDQTLPFMAVDAALKTQHDLLIVEEAGSLPIAVLLELMQRSRSIIFATTVQGYEGAGRGFALRFTRHLDVHQPGWLKLSPTEPIRWSRGDPVEAFVNDALLLNATTPTLKNAEQLHAASSTIRQIHPQEFLNDDALLEKLFGLLLAAHYQTSPADLRNMLEQHRATHQNQQKPHSQLSVYGQFCHGQVTGAVLLATEGCISTELHNAIHEKKRRLPDQILPQVLAQTSGDATIMSNKYARVVRIAVHPELRRQGFGRQLFHQLRKQLLPDTTIGASFGADESSLSFWLALGCRPVHYGFKTNPRSGQRAACVMLSEHDAIQQCIEFACGVLHLNIRAKDSIGNDLTHEEALLSKATQHSTDSLSLVQAGSLIKDYTMAHRSFSDTVGLLLTHERLLTENTIQSEVHTLLNSLSTLSPKQRRDADSELRQIIAQQIDL